MFEYKDRDLSHYRGNFFLHALPHFLPDGLFLRSQQIIEMIIVWSCSSISTYETKKQKKIIEI